MVWAYFGRKDMPIRKAEEFADLLIDVLTNRKGLRHEWDNIEERIQAEIREEWAVIIEQAQREALDTAGGIADMHDWRGDVGLAIRNLIPKREEGGE
jgi:hypothetical protein